MCNLSNTVQCVNRVYDEKMKDALEKVQYKDLK